MLEMSLCADVMWMSRYNATEFNVRRVCDRYEDIGPYFTQVNSTIRPITG